MPRHFISGVLSFCLLGCLAANVPLRADGLSPDSLKERLPTGVLRWAGDIEGGAPFQFRDPADPDRIIGFEVDVVEAIVDVWREKTARPDLKAEFVQYEWVSLPQGLEKRDFDVIVSGFEITRENSAKTAFSRPYYLFGQQLTVRADETRIREAADCRELPVGTLSGSAANHWLERLGATAITAYEGQIEPYQDLAIRRLDAVLLDMPIAVQNAADDPRFKFAGAPVGWSGYGIAARPEDGPLLAAINDAVGELIRRGRLEVIYRKWKLWNDEQRQLAELDTPDKLLAWSKQRNGDDGGATEEWTLDKYFPLLLKASGVTVGLTIISMAVAMGIGLIVAVCRLYGPAPVRMAALAYVEFFRGIPLLLLLTFLYYGLPHTPYLGISLTAVQAAILGFGLNYAAFEAEIYRSSILAVPRGQWEAAYALGMNDVATFRRVIFPQAFRTALGPMTNDFVAMFKDTSLVSVIAVVELTKQYQILARSSLKFGEIGALTALMYLLMSVPLGYLARYLEDRWSAGHR